MKETKIKAILYSRVGETGRAVGDLKDIVPQIELPAGFRLEGGERKFIVIVSDDELCVAIGPSMDNGYYYHKDILQATGKGKQFIRGGGSLTVVVESDKQYSRVKFGGSSGDFGVFDYRTLAPEVREYLQKELGCRVSFSWGS